MSDLPTLGTVVPGGATVHLVEAIGDGPSLELIANTISLAEADVLSGAAIFSKLRRFSDGRPAYTRERWVRLQFSPPFGDITKLRFWVDDYSPSSGWDLYWGQSAFYRKPVGDLSSFAGVTVPTTDPVASNLGLIRSGELVASAWVVLQAHWTGSIGPMQATPIHIRFAWTES
jgi:hypothetical protein